MPDTMTIGRVGFDIILDAPFDWSEAAAETRMEEVTGWLFAETYEDAIVLRNEILDEVNHMVAVTFEDEPKFNGFYKLTNVNVDAPSWSLPNKTFPFSATFQRIGGTSKVFFESQLTSILVRNAYTLTEAEVTFWHSPPVNALAYNSGNNTPATRARTTEDGDISFIAGITTVTSPSWSVEPLDYYKGAARIKVDGRIRSGTDITNSVANWELSNGLVRVTPGLTGTESNGRILVAHFDGSTWTSADSFKIVFNPTGSNAPIPRWHYMNVIHNTAEMVAIRLTRDAEESPATTHQHILDLILRRGSLFVSCYFVWAGEKTNFGVGPDSSTAVVTLTPTGADAPVGVERSSADAGGDKFVIGTAFTHTENTSTGLITFTDGSGDPGWGYEFDFFIGKRLNDTADAYNSGLGQCLQYLGWSEEQVKAVTR